MSVSSEQVISGWLVGPASADDRVMLQALLSQRQGHYDFITPTPWRPWRQILAPAFLGPLQAAGQPALTRTYLADKGFNGFKWQQHWYRHYAVNVLTEPSRHRHSAPLPRSWAKWFRGLRQPIETTFAVLWEVFDIKHLKAHSRWGQYTRLALATAAFNWGVWLNRQLRRPPLAHATLLC